MLTLPTPIAAYVDATNARLPDQVAACFQPDATVRDEGHVQRGRAQIAAWAADTGERYRATMEPVSLSSADGQHLLRATVRGDFAGSPATLVFRFALANEAIDALEITA